MHVCILTEWETVYEGFHLWILLDLMKLELQIQGAFAFGILMEAALFTGQNLSQKRKYSYLKQYLIPQLVSILPISHQHF